MLCCREHDVAQQTAAVAARERNVQQQEAKYGQLQQLVEALGQHVHQLIPLQVRVLLLCLAASAGPALQGPSGLTAPV